MTPTPWAILQYHEYGELPQIALRPDIPQCASVAKLLTLLVDTNEHMMNIHVHIHTFPMMAYNLQTNDAYNMQDILY